MVLEASPRDLVEFLDALRRGHHGGAGVEDVAVLLVDVGTPAGEVSGLEEGRLETRCLKANRRRETTEAGADDRGSPIAVIQGTDEREKGEINVKDLVEGMRLSQEITDNEEWRASRPAQRTVKREELVETVQAILAEQKAERDA